ncbi:MAG: M6 family metalloprotease domain-containing protein [Bacteroidota bacterium]
MPSAWAQHPPSPGLPFPAFVPAPAAEADPSTVSWARRLAARRALLEASAGKTTAPADTFQLPVLLGQYADRAGTFSADAFEAHLFGVNPSGNLPDYYTEVSYGQFYVQGAVYGWFEAPEPQSFYAGTRNGFSASFPGSARGFVRHVVEAADASVDFAQYDNDGPDGRPNSGDDDGVVDGVFVVFPGPGADWFPSNDNLWPHMTSLGNQAYTTQDRGANGSFIRVDPYAVVPERAGGGPEGQDSLRPLGVFAHELGHFLGLPDLYDRAGSGAGPNADGSEGLGGWDLMATGSWGGNGRSPARPSHLSAWSKMQLGWLQPTTLVGRLDDVALSSTTTTPSAYRLWDDPFEGTRYFLIENRQQEGFDEQLHGGGLLIYHVDENRRYGSACWSCGPINDDETHKLIDLEAADGRADLDTKQNRGDAGDPFPGTTGTSSFGPRTQPSSQRYDNTDTGISVQRITPDGTVMRFDVDAPAPQGTFLAYDEDGMSGFGWGFDDARPSWVGVHFTLSQDAALAAVDVGLRHRDVRYRVAVHAGFDPDQRQPGPLLISEEGAASSRGWHTHTFETPVFLNGTREVFVTIRLEGKHTYEHSYDRWGPRSGRSYFSEDGQRWSDSISRLNTGGDLNLRLRLLSRPDGVQTAVDSEAPAAPTSRLLAPYPHPIRTSAAVPFETNEAGRVTLRVYDVLGREVALLLDAALPAGAHETSWPGQGYAPGVYLLRLDTPSHQDTRTVVVLRAN